MPKSKPKVFSRVLGSGMSVPSRVIENNYFASYLDTTDEWIQDRTGIVERRWVEKGVGASELAAPAAIQAIKNAALNVSDIQAIVFATATPDYAYPSSACVLQKRLGIPNTALAFDINAVCSGFVYAITTADSLIARGIVKNVLVIGADIFSSSINPNDRATCVLFGDGAGAVVLGAVDDDSDRGIYGSILGADGNYGDILCAKIGSAAPVTAESLAANSHYLQMQGKEVFKLAVRRLGEINQEILVKYGYNSSEVNYFVSHQANKRILTATAERLGIGLDRMPINLEKYGNTSAASIPIVLAEFEQAGKIKAGDLIVLSAFGAGVTWGAVILRW